MNITPDISLLHGFQFGRVVYGIEMCKFGHIVGFGRNTSGELLIRVQWECDRSFQTNESVVAAKTFIHPANVKFY